MIDPIQYLPDSALKYVPLAFILFGSTMIGLSMGGVIISLTYLFAYSPALGFVFLLPCSMSAITIAAISRYWMTVSPHFRGNFIRDNDIFKDPFKEGEK